MKVCIFGAGAIGGFVGASVAQVPGVDVSFIARGPHLAAMRNAGLRLLIDGEERVVRLRCTDNPRELGPQNYVILLKAHAISDVLALIRQRARFADAGSVPERTNGDCLCPLS